jgi:GNAT superfamily N-acetyltransferase
MLPLPDGFSLRQASADEAPIVVAHRRAMFAAMGYADSSALDAMAAKFLPWVEAKMRADEYLAWFAVSADGKIAAGAGLWLMEWPAHMLGSSRRGNIINVYTEPEFRRLGLSRRLMHPVLDWCRSNRIHLVILHASPEGRALYESLGFRPSNEMRISL